jgi:hypothetical protein
VPTASESADAASETLSTVLTALDVLGWSTEAAREAVSAAAEKVVTPPGSVSFLGEEMTLLDAFSANDTQSLERLWSEWRRVLTAPSDWSVLLNTRADRPLRTRQFCRWLAGRNDIDEVYVAGSHQAVAARLLRSHKLRVTRLPAGVTQAASSSGRPRKTRGSARILVGIGNVQGLGLSVRQAAGGGRH